MKYLRLLWANIIPVAIVGIIGFLVLTRVQSCRDSDTSKEGAIMAERVRVDTIVDRSDSVGRAAAERQLNAANETITQLVGRIRSAPQPIPVGTPHDSITHLTAAVKSCREDSDSLVRSVVRLQSACGAYRDSATKSLANKDTRYAHLDSLYKIGKPPKRWGIGPYVGYGINTDSAYAMRRGFSAGVAIHYSIFSW